MIVASIFFILFALAYAMGVAFCIYQEQGLSLPHEKAVRMTAIIIVLSAALFVLALYAFLHIDWDAFTVLSKNRP